METINLAGSWEFRLDPHNEGIEQQWFNHKLEGAIALPGTTDEGGYGEMTGKEDPLRLSRKHKYVGPAWYRKHIIIPASWKDKTLSLFLERCMWKSTVWIDGQLAGSSNSLSAPHAYELTQRLTSGAHTITIRVDNSRQANLGAWSHGWSEEVQTIWNGIIGKLELRAVDPVSIYDVKIYPDYANRKIKVAARVENRTGQTMAGKLHFQVEDSNCGVIQSATAGYGSSLLTSVVQAELELGDEVKPWDEFEPSLYRLTTSLTSAEAGLFVHKRTDRFGLRDFRAEGTRFKLNDYYIYLRGTHDAGNFPFTGYPAMDKAHWLQIYETAKAYGLNHFRFHSWCPPKAAFEAADETGIILQAELPLFSIGAERIGKDAQRDDFLREELRRILEEYGNHPSFCMMCMGNELSGDYTVLDSFVMEGRNSDPRHLYCTAANNAAEPSVGIQPRACDDFYVAHESRVGGERDVRRCEHLFTEKPPETMGDYGYTLHSIGVPTVSHEVGQWAVYPNYKEIGKYTGVLEPRNLIQFQRSLEANGMLHQADDFLKASGALSLALYREEIERSLRTADYGGFQLLDIHDYPGQGTSLVGILDAFWDTKGLIAPEKFRQFCNPVVPLLRMPKRIFTSGESFKAAVELSNYGRVRLEGLTVRWVLMDSDGKVRKQGQFDGGCAGQGTVSPLGVIEFECDYQTEAEAFKLEVMVDEADVRSDWTIWLLPEEHAATSDVYISDVWNDETEKRLQDGGCVLLTAAQMERSEAASFTTPFWNTQLFPNQAKTMGLLCDPGHQALSHFPTGFHTDWQWWDVFTGARAVDMSSSPVDGELIIQAIDHPIRNHKLGLLFERAVGNGRLFVSGFDLINNLENRPAAKRLKTSLLRYMQGDGFQPVCQWEMKEARNFLRSKAKNNLASFVESIQASSTHWTANSRNLTDGKADTFWMSENRPYPHEIIFKLDREVTVKGFIYTPLQDGRTNGRVADYEWYVSRDAENFGEPVAKGTFEPNEKPKRIELDWINDGFNVTRSKQGRFIRFVALSGYGEDTTVAFSELDIVTD